MDKQSNQMIHGMLTLHTVSLGKLMAWINDEYYQILINRLLDIQFSLKARLFVIIKCLKYLVKAHCQCDFTPLIRVLMVNNTTRWLRLKHKKESDIMMQQFECKIWELLCSSCSVSNFGPVILSFALYKDGSSLIIHW